MSGSIIWKFIDIPYSHFIKQFTRLIAFVNYNFFFHKINYLIIIVNKPGFEPGFARFRLYVSIVVQTSPIVFPASRLASRIIKLSVYQFRHLSLLKGALSSQTVHYTTHKHKIKHYRKVPYPILAIGCRSIRQ